jgi:hypothetical protein
VPITESWGQAPFYFVYIAILASWAPIYFAFHLHEVLLSMLANKQNVDAQIATDPLAI